MTAPMLPRIPTSHDNSIRSEGSTDHMYIQALLRAARVQPASNRPGAQVTDFGAAQALRGDLPEGGVAPDETVVEVDGTLIRGNVVDDRLVVVVGVNSSALGSMSVGVALLRANAVMEEGCRSAWGGGDEGRQLLLRTSIDRHAFMDDAERAEAWIGEVVSLVKRVAETVSGHGASRSVEALGAEVVAVLSPYAAGEYSPVADPEAGDVDDVAVRAVAGRFASDVLIAPASGLEIPLEAGSRLVLRRLVHNGRTVLSVRMPGLAAAPCSVAEVVGALGMTADTAFSTPAFSMSVDGEGVSLCWTIDPRHTLEGSLERFVDESAGPR